MMYKYLPYAVVVFPQALLNYFKNVVCKPPFHVLESLEIQDIWTEDDMCYIDFSGSEKDYFELERRLTDASIPYNFYPINLDMFVTFVRLINNGAEVIRNSTSYGSFISHKHMEIPNRRKHVEYMIELEHNWENQVELCLKQSILNLLEE